MVGIFGLLIEISVNVDDVQLIFVSQSSRPNLVDAHRGRHLSCSTNVSTECADPSLSVAQAPSHTMHTF